MRDKKTWTILTLGCAMALTTFGAAPSGVAEAQAEATKGPTAGAQVAEVVRQLHAINQAEIALGKLAEKRAQAPEIKGFGALMVKDHTAADKSLTEVAGKQNIDLRAAATNPIVKAMGMADEARDKRLDGMRGAAFDVAYIAPEASDHELAIQIADAGISQTEGEMKQMLEATRSMLTVHRDHARDIEKQLVLRPTAVGGGPSEGHSGAKPPTGQHGK